MPTYEYACEKCGHQFEFFQSMKDKPLTVCPKEKCKLKKWGKGRVKKMMGAGAGLIFKGSGFYVNDSRNGSNGNGKAKKSESSSETKSETKAETKTETKSESKPEKVEASSASSE